MKNDIDYYDNQYIYLCTLFHYISQGTVKESTKNVNEDITIVFEREGLKGAFWCVPQSAHLKDNTTKAH